MFRFFKKSNPDKLERKLEQQYRRKLEEAQAAQRSGKMPRYAVLTAEAEDLGRMLDRARAERAGGTYD